MCLGCGTAEAVRWKLCNGCAHLLVSGCLGKARLRQDAAGARRRDGETKPYLCDLCADWHVGKIIPGQEARDERRRDLIKKIREAGFGWLLGQIVDEAGRMDRNAWKSDRTWRFDVRTS
jgi:hypothetical protein